MSLSRPESDVSIMDDTRPEVAFRQAPAAAVRRATVSLASRVATLRLALALLVLLVQKLLLLTALKQSLKLRPLTELDALGDFVCCCCPPWHRGQQKVRAASQGILVQACGEPVPAPRNNSDHPQPAALGNVQHGVGRDGTDTFLEIVQGRTSQGCSWRKPRAPSKFLRRRVITFTRHEVGVQRARDVRCKQPHTKLKCNQRSLRAKCAMSEGGTRRPRDARCAHTNFTVERPLSGKQTMPQAPLRTSQGRENKPSCRQHEVLHCLAYGSGLCTRL